MIRNHRYLLIVLIALYGIVWMACTQQRQPCLTPKIAILNVECMHKTSDTGTVFVDTALPHAVFLALTDSGARGGYYPQQSLFTLSLSPLSDTCMWAFRTDTMAHIYDTITFYYKRNLQFLSNACGYTYFYTLTSVYAKGSMIDSVHITNTSVTNNVNTKHLQIYIHPDF